MWSRRPPPDRLEDWSGRQLVRAYDEIDRGDGEAPDAAERADRADRIAAELLRRDPTVHGLWFDRALLAKWRRDWPAAVEFGTRALDLVPLEQREQEPAAWNLGIAATARRDWATARAAWTAFGISIGGEGADPIAEDMGLVPVRLNPPPRFVGRREVEVDGRTWETEVVWGTRLDPARVQLVSVPLPTSGHRYGDVVLHDGDVHGSRELDGQEVPVFEEIELWERSPRPTLSLVLRGSDDDVEELLAALDAEGLAAEDWTSNVRRLCPACSEGSPGAHDHPAGSASADDRTIGLSGDPDDAERIVAAWLREGDRHSDGLAVELE